MKIGNYSDLTKISSQLKMALCLICLLLSYLLSYKDIVFQNISQVFSVMLLWILHDKENTTGVTMDSTYHQQL